MSLKKVERETWMPPQLCMLDFFDTAGGTSLPGSKERLSANEGGSSANNSCINPRHPQFDPQST